MDKQKPALQVTIKVGAKRGVSVYGLQRMPITLYADQWIDLMALKADILAFIETNKDQLSFKEQREEGRE